MQLSSASPWTRAHPTGREPGKGKVRRERSPGAVFLPTRLALLPPGSSSRLRSPTQVRPAPDSGRVGDGEEVQHQHWGGTFRLPPGG